MTDNRTMAEMLRAPTEGCAEAIIVPSILAEQFELKHSLINMMTSEQFFGLKKDNPHDHVRWFNKITSTIKYKDVPNSVIKLILFPFSLAGATRQWLEKEPPRSITTWDDLVLKFINEFFPPSRTTNLRNEISNFQPKFDESFHEAWERYKDLLRACPHHGFTELHQLDTFYNALNPADQDSLNAAAGGNLLEKSPQDALTIIENKSKTNEIKNTMASLLQMNIASTSGSGSLPSNTVANPKGKLKAITTRSGLVTDGPTVPTPPKSVTPGEEECVEETYTDPNLAEYIMKQEKDDIQIQKFWNMFKQLHLNITLAEALVLMPKYQKMLKALLSNKEKLQELANTPLNENCSAVILTKLPEKLGDPEKFLILCGFSELKCKALADLGASINLMPLSVWKKFGLPYLIPTRMNLELANRVICMPDGITRDVFVPVGKFTFPAHFVIVDYESDHRFPLILGRPFLRTARALIDVHGEEMILCDGDERLTLNMKHDTASYSNHPYRDSVNLINIFNISSEDCLEDLVSNKQSGNPTFLLHKEITSPKVIHEIHASKGCNFLYEELLDIYSFNDIHPHFDDNSLSGSTTYSANSLLKEFTDELALITYPPNYDDNRTYDIESDLREIEFLLYQGEDSDYKDSIDQLDLANLDDLFVDLTPEMFTDEQPPDYSFPPRFDVYPNDFLEIKSDADNFDDDLFDSEGEKIKEAELLLDQLDLPCDIHSEYDSFASQDFSRDDDLPSPDNEDKVFNLRILIHEKSVKIITRVQEKKLAVSYASLVFEDFDPPFYELLVFKEVPKSMRFLCFQSQSDFHKPDEDFSCSKWKEYSSVGCSSVPFLSPLIHSSMGEFGPAL
uniref:Reverse transcriptase domain-containing protein n=1 Tax=Tanacetum cinerariifolium TaxID=118510 RepID=A0A6L2MTH5_TANCI|nr:reverse transcriptase domain-containing protein [Tanacetum cinerariifolium]